MPALFLLLQIWEEKATFPESMMFGTDSTGDILKGILEDFLHDLFYLRFFL